MTDATIAAPTVAATPVKSALADIWKQFRAHRAAWPDLSSFIFILLAVYVVPYIHTVAPNAINVRERNQWPSLRIPSAPINSARTCWHSFGGRTHFARRRHHSHASGAVSRHAGRCSLRLFPPADGPLMRLRDLFRLCRCCRCVLVILLLFRDTLRVRPSGRGPASSSLSSS